MRKTSAGILIYKLVNNELKIFLTHPGGPYNKNKDLGFWSIVKGEVDEGEDLLDAALREVSEETYFKISNEATLIPLDYITQKNGKVVHAWAYEYKGHNESNLLNTETNLATIEWPPKSEKFIKIPENDKGEFFDKDSAKQKINPAQVELIERLEELIININK